MRDTIDMARESGLLTHIPFRSDTEVSAALKAFEALVRADERAALMQLFTDPENQPTQHGTVTLEHMQREVAVEREACANLFPQPYMEYFGREIQDAIRARGETK
jgi:hypothetical protein